MVKVRENDELVLAKKPPWSKNPGYTIKKAPPKVCTPRQREVRDRFGMRAQEAAVEAIGFAGEAKVRAINNYISKHHSGFRAEGWGTIGPNRNPRPLHSEKEELPPGLPSINDNPEGSLYLKELIK